MMQAQVEFPGGNFQPSIYPGTVSVITRLWRSTAEGFCPHGAMHRSPSWSNQRAILDCHGGRWLLSFGTWLLKNLTDICLTGHRSVLHFLFFQSSWTWWVLPCFLDNLWWMYGWLTTQRCKMLGNEGNKEALWDNTLLIGILSGSQVFLS